MEDIGTQTGLKEWQGARGTTTDRILVSSLPFRLSEDPTILRAKVNFRWIIPRRGNRVGRGRRQRVSNWGGEGEERSGPKR